MPCFRLCFLGIERLIAPQSFCTGLYVKMHGRRNVYHVKGMEWKRMFVQYPHEFDLSSWKDWLFIKCRGFIAVGGSTPQILQVMNSRMHMNFSFPCLMGSTKRWRRIGGNPIVKVNCFLFLSPLCCFHLLNDLRGRRE